MADRKSYLGLILMGSLIGLSETLLGSMAMPHYRSVVLSTITLALLALARLWCPGIGTSLLIMAIAVIFKMTNLGVLGCKPAALLVLGVSFEIFASLIIARASFSYFRYLLVSALTALTTFALFASVETFIIKNQYWTLDRFTSYIFINGSLTAVCSALLNLAVLASARKLAGAYNPATVKQTATQAVLGCFIIAAWLIGYLAV